MKVGFAIPTFFGSGAIVYVHRLINALEKRYVDTFLLKYSINKYGIVFKKPYIDFKELENCDVLHLPSDHAFLFKKLRKKKIITLHHLAFDSEYLKYTNFIQRLHYTLFLKRYIRKSLDIADEIIAVSNYTKQSILKTFGNLNIKVIYNGIDTEKFRPLPPKRKDKNIKLLFVGNLIKRKGVDLLPPIINRLDDNYILYYTTGLRTGKIFKQRRMFPLEKLSENELIKQYNECDILLFPTRLEGFGYAVAEAMACGKPVVTTNCSSLPELVENGENGFLCEMDNVDDFVEKIKILGDNEELRKKIGKTNREKIFKKFSIEQMAKQYVKVYKEIINKK